MAPYARAVASLNLVLPMLGAAAITLATQLRIDLAFTPVPITAQTFAVILWGMLFGARHGALAAITYLSAGAVGAPVFAGFTSLTALWGPTSGYLLGFIPGAFLAGTLAQRSFAQTIHGSILTAFIAHIPILVIGAAVMSLFTGSAQSWALGIAPFLPGDIVKSIAASVIFLSLQRLKRGA